MRRSGYTSPKACRGGQGRPKAAIGGCFCLFVSSIYCRLFGSLGAHKPISTTAVTSHSKTPFSYEKSYVKMADQAPPAPVAGPPNHPLAYRAIVFTLGATGEVGGWLPASRALRPPPPTPPPRRQRWPALSLYSMPRPLWGVGRVHHRCGSAGARRSTCARRASSSPNQILNN